MIYEYDIATTTIHAGGCGGDCGTGGGHCDGDCNG